MNQINLDINKAGQIINEPVVLRVGEKDQTITVSLLKDGQPYTAFTTATFYANKPSGSIVANDPANISNGVITYTVPQALVSEFGKITNAYFLIDGKTSTESFVIAVLQGVNISDDLNDYIPGMSNLNVIYDKWKAKLDGITREMAGIDAPKEVKNVIDNELKNYINQINDLKGRITAAQDQLDALKVPKFGTRNLLLNTENFATGTGVITQNGGSWDNNNVLMEDVPTFGNADLWNSQTTVYATADSYTITFWAKADTDGNTFECFFFGPNTTTSAYTSQGKKETNNDGSIAIVLSENWTRYWITWNQTPSNEYKKVIVGRVNSNSTNVGKIYMTKPNLVEGNQPADWGLAPEEIVRVYDTINWQKQSIFKTNSYYYDHCPSDTDFGEFLKSDKVPMGFSIIRTESDGIDWKIIKEGVAWNAIVVGTASDGFGHQFHCEVLNGVYSGRKNVLYDLQGLALKLKDSTGKETTYTITGIS